MSETQKFKPYKEVVGKKEISSQTRLTKRGKAVLGAAGVSLLAASASIVGNASSNPYEQELKDGKFIEYVVQPGDTADQIARSVVGEENEKRNLSGELYEQATRDGTPMTPGEVLHIPLSEVHNTDSIIVRHGSGSEN